MITQVCPMCRIQRYGGQEGQQGNADHLGPGTLTCDAALSQRRSRLRSFSRARQWVRLMKGPPADFCRHANKGKAVSRYATWRAISIFAENSNQLCCKCISVP